MIPVEAVEAAASGCTCTVTDSKYWTTHYGAVEPNSTLERTPGCPEHFPQPPMPVPTEYCGGGICWKLAERWEYVGRYAAWIPVCNEHGDRIADREARK